MDPYENNGAPPAGGFGAPGDGPAGFGPTGGWGPMQVEPAPAPIDKMARVSSYLGIASIPGIFCNVIGLPMAVAAVALGIAALYRMRGNAHAPGRRHAIGGIACGGLVIVGIASILAYFVFCVPGFR